MINNPKSTPLKKKKWEEIIDSRLPDNGNSNKATSSYTDFDPDSFVKDVLSFKPAPLPGQEKDDTFGDNFVEGLEQGGKGLSTGFGYAVGETLDRLGFDEKGEKVKRGARVVAQDVPASDDSWGQFLGSLIPSTVPTAAAITLAPFTGGSSIPAIASIGALSASSAGNGMMEYEAYQHARGKEVDPMAKLGVGITYGVAEGLFEKFQLGKLVPSPGKLLLKGNIRNAKKVGENVLEAYKKANPNGYRGLISKINAGLTTEGFEEIGTELVQFGTQYLYNEEEDRLNLVEQLPDNIGRAFLGGSIMGAGLGPLSYGSQIVTNRKRREANGGVLLAQSKEDGATYEILGLNPVSGNKEATYTGIDKNGNPVILKESEIGERVKLSVDQFDKLLQDKLDEQEVRLSQMEPKMMATYGEQEVVVKGPAETEDKVYIKLPDGTNKSVFASELKDQQPISPEEQYLAEGNEIVDQPIETVESLRDKDELVQNAEGDFLYPGDEGYDEVVEQQNLAEKELSQRKANTRTIDIGTGSQSQRVALVPNDNDGYQVGGLTRINKNAEPESVDLNSLTETEISDLSESLNKALQGKGLESFVEPVDSEDPLSGSSINVYPTDSKKVEQKRLEKYEIEADGALVKVMNRESGKEVTSRSKYYLPKVKEYFQQTAGVYSDMERVTDDPSVSEHNYINEIASYSDNPVEISEAYKQALEDAENKTSLSTKRMAIAYDLADSKIPSSDLQGRGLDNPVFNAQYVSPNADTDIAQRADYLSDQLGQEVTVDDILDFIKDNPGGPKKVLNEKDPLVQKLEERFKKATGADISPELARTIIDSSLESISESQNSVDADVNDEISRLEQELKENGVTDEELEAITEQAGQLTLAEIEAIEAEIEAKATGQDQLETLNALFAEDITGQSSNSEQLIEQDEPKTEKGDDSTGVMIEKDESPDSEESSEENDILKNDATNKPTKTLLSRSRKPTPRENRRVNKKDKERERSFSEEEKREGEQEYSSTQFNLDLPEVVEFAKTIPDEELFEPNSERYGREEETHVTALYGLTTDNSEEVRKVVEGFGDFEIRLGKTSLFENEEYDVLKIDVKSKELREMNNLLSNSLDNENSFPDYKPHVTIAYLKPGEGKKYEGDNRFEGKSILVSELLFSGKDRAKTAIDLDKVESSQNANNESKLAEKEQSVKEELSDLFDEFDDLIGGQINTGIDPKLIVVSGKIIAKGAELGFIKFQQFADWVASNKGLEFWKKIFPSFKAAYSANVVMNGNPNEEDLNALAKSKADDYVQIKEEEPINELETQEDYRLAVQSLLDRYNEGDEVVGTIQDLVDEVEELASDIESDDVINAVLEYRSQQEYDIELSGRNDMDQAEVEFIESIEEYLTEEKEEVKEITRKNYTSEDGKVYPIYEVGDTISKNQKEYIVTKSNNVDQYSSDFLKNLNVGYVRGKERGSKDDYLIHVIPLNNESANNVKNNDIDINQSEESNVTTASSNLESNSPRRESSDRVGEKDVQSSGREDRVRDGEGSQSIIQTGLFEQSDPSISNRIPVATGETGNTEIFGERESAGNNDTDTREQGGSNSDIDSGVSFREERSGEVTDATKSENSSELSLSEKLKLQEEAEGIKVVSADINNIKETLPVLFGPQQEDVFKAETRFSNKSSYENPTVGILFTNGTGTGKTYTGLGIAKRFHKQKKKNILIVVPTDTKAKDWIEDGQNLIIPVRQLVDTQDGGNNNEVVVTTYANFRQNEALKERDFDLVIYDESHKIMSSKGGDQTASLLQHRYITNAPSYLKEKATDRIVGPNPYKQFGRDFINNLSDEEHENIVGTYNRLKEEKSEEIDALSKQLYDKTKVVFLSATPFSYHFNLDYADGYLYQISEGVEHEFTGYNIPDPRDSFYITNFGYRMRYNRLTQPEAEVDSSLMEREFHTNIEESGAVSTRILQLDYDYSRDFILVDDVLGSEIDRGLSILWEEKIIRGGTEESRYPNLYEFVRKQFTWVRKNQILESIKARKSLDRFEKHIERGRKVVVFHSYLTNDPVHPFDFSKVEFAQGDGSIELRKEADDFMSNHPELVNLDLSGLINPVDTILNYFGDKAVAYNGSVSKKERNKNIKLFNQDNSGTDILVVQMEAGKEGISLHDKTSKHQRVMHNLGLPYKPTDAIQSEGRVYRVGQRSDAIFEYPVLHLNFEQSAFAEKINKRVKTAENLSLGKRARNLESSFKDGYTMAQMDVDLDNQGTGGKELDFVSNEISDFDRAKTYYYGRQKRSAKTKSMEGKDYYATPEPIGLKMVEFLHLKKNEKALEPSAGHGAIARFFPEFTDNTFIEPSWSLANQVSLNASGNLKNIRFEDLNIVNKFHGIAMNPPFGSGGKTAMEHIDKAFNNHLYDSGRLVAIIPQGPSMDKRLNKWLEAEEGLGSSAYLSMDIELPDVTFERAATKVNTRLIVIDKINDQEKAKSIPVQRNLSLNHIENINELFDRLNEINIDGRVELLADVTSESVEEINTPSSDAIEVVRSKHTRDDYDIWTAKLNDRVDRELFNELRRLAKANSGYYSRYNKGDAIPGFIFKEENDSKKFLSDVAEVYPDMFNDEKDFLAKRIDDLPSESDERTNEIANYLEGIIKNWKTKNRITIARSIEDLPYIVQMYMENNNSEIGGVYLDGKVYINAFIYDSIELAEKTLLHETVGHLGFRGLLENMSSNKEQYERIYTDLTLSIYDNFKNDSEFQRISKKYGFDFRKTVDKSLAAEEFLAHMAERGDVAKSFVDRFIQLIKDVLANLGFKTRLTRADLIDLITDMRRFVDSDISVYNDGHIMRAAFKIDRAKPFYSQLEEVLQSKLSGKGTAESYKTQIEGFERKGDFRKAEIEWVGLYEWLDEQKGKLSREDVVGFVKDNQVQLEEVMKGGSNITTYTPENYEEFPEEVSAIFDKHDDDGFAISSDLEDLGYEVDIDLSGEISQFSKRNAPKLEWNKSTYLGREAVVANIDEDLYEPTYIVEDLDENDNPTGKFVAISDGAPEMYGESIDEIKNKLQQEFDEIQKDKFKETKYSSHTLPGGVDYREMLITLPNRVTSVTKNSIDPNASLEDFQLEETITRERDSDYRNSHWNEPNVLAHVRFNTREGNMLFIEEIQSDWHQDGRKKGYKFNKSELEKRKLEKNTRENVADDFYEDFISFKNKDQSITTKLLEDISEAYTLAEETNEKSLLNNARNFSEVITTLPSASEISDEIAVELSKAYIAFHNAEKKLNSSIKELIENKRRGVPDAPFKTSWHELVMKRMIRYAAENGFRKVGWTPGEVQNERYDLSKQVDEVNVELKDGIYNLKGSKHPRSFDIGSFKEEELESVVGKELAKKIIEKGSGAYGGADLEIGGEGMKGFYDKILPRFVNKYLKKWDSKLGVVEIDISGGKPTEYGNYDNYVDAQKNKKEVWSFDVTPDMMESVLGEGQPLFKIEDNEPSPRGQKLKQWFMSIGGNPLNEQPHQYQKTVDGILRRYQNKFIDGKRIQEGVVTDGGKVSDKSDFVQDEENHYGRIENLRTEIDNKFVNPIIEKMRSLYNEKEVTYDDLRNFLYAKHAPERNEDLLEKNPGAGPSQSGMTDAESENILAGFKERNVLSELEDVSTLVYELNKENLRRQYIGGLISKERFGTLLKKFDYYVPLRGFDELMEIDPTLYSFDKQMEGRSSKAGDILGYVLAMSDTAIIHGEKNRVKQTFLEFVKDNYERSDLFRIRNVFWKNTGEIDPETGKEKWLAIYTQPTPQELLDGRVKRRLNPEKEQQLWEQNSNIYEESTVKVMVDGRPVIIEMTKPHIARAFAEMDVSEVPGELGVIATMMNYLRNVITQYSPEFGLRNLIRDSWTGLINVAIDQNITEASKIVNPVAYAGAMKAIHSYYRKGTFDDSEWGKAMKSFMKHGAVTGYWQLNQVKKRTKALRTEIERGSFSQNPIANTKAGFKALGEFLDDYNRILENVARVSAYKHLFYDKVTNPKTGKPYTEKQAANYARNLTVNFNRKGSGGNFMGSIYLFFNATVQGITRQVQPFFSENSRIRNRAMVAPILMGTTSFMFAELMRLGLGKDEDEEWKYDKINDFTRTHNILLPNWFSDDPDDYLKIPLPYGFNTYWAAGDAANRFANGSTDIAESALEMAVTTIDAYNPIGTASGSNFGGAAYKSLLPTIAKPGYELITNTDFAGNRIKPEPFPFSVEPPESQQYYKYTATWAKETAKWLNSVTGGDEFTEGYIDVSPEYLEYVAQYFGGGPAKFIDGLAQTGENAYEHITGLEEVELYDIYDVPFARSFYGKISRRSTREAFIENKKVVENLISDVESYYETGQVDKARKYQDKNKEMLSLYNNLKAVEKQKRAFGKMMDFYVRQQNANDSPEIRDKIKNVVEAEFELYLEFNRLVNEVKGKADRTSPLQKIHEALNEN